MHVIGRVLLSAALVVTDVGQILPATAAENGGWYGGTASGSSKPHLRHALTDGDAMWKRLSTSICIGCGGEQRPQAVAVAPEDALLRRPLPASAVATKEPTVAPASSTSEVKVVAAQPVRVRYTSTQRQASRRRVQMAVRARQRSRLAALRAARKQRRLAQARLRYASQPSQTRRVQQQARSRRGYVQLASNWVSPRDRGYPLPPRSRPRPALCAYDRGFFTVAGLWPTTCVSSY